MSISHRRKSLSKEDIQDLPWGAAFLREFDLVLAANVLHELERQSLLSDDLLGQRIAAFCQPLDLGLEPKFLGVAPIPEVPGQTQHASLQMMLDELAVYPRGHWAIIQQGDKFGAWMANGVGGISAPSGNKFNYSSPDAPGLNFEDHYAAVLSTMVYDQRNKVTQEIVDLALNNLNLVKDAKFKNMVFSGRTWTNVTYMGPSTNYYVGGSSSYSLIATRPGVSPRRFRFESTPFMRLMGGVPVMPDAYIDPDNENRLESLREKRSKAAQAVWNRLTADAPLEERMQVAGEFDRADEMEFHRWGSGARFRVEGDIYYRTAYVSNEDDGSPRYTYTVTFAPGGDRIISKTIIRNQTSPLPDLAA